MESKTAWNICVTGAAGNTAYQLIGLLASGSVFGPKQTINLKLLDVEAQRQHLEAISLEIEDCCFPLLQNVQYGCDNEDDMNKLFKDMDICILLGGHPRKPGMDKHDWLLLNKEIFQRQGKVLNQVAKPTCKLLMVANPTNTNCLTLALNCPNIPKKNIVSLIRLDLNRAIVQLAKKANVAPNQVQDVLVWGNHSPNLFPDYHYAKINNKNITELLKDQQEWLQDEYITNVQKRGGQIIQVSQKTLVFSAAYSIKDFLRDWYFGPDKDQMISMGIFIEDKEYYNMIPPQLVFSMPVYCKNFEFRIIDNLQLNEFQIKKIQICVDELLLEKEETYTNLNDSDANQSNDECQ